MYGQTAAPKMIGLTKKQRQKQRRERQHRERAAAAVAAVPLTVAAAAQDAGKDEAKKNKGLALLQKMGWTPGQGIGASGNQGRVVAVDALREGARAARDRTGVGGGVEAGLAPRRGGKKKRRRY